MQLLRHGRPSTVRWAASAALVLLLSSGGLALGLTPTNGPTVPAPPAEEPASSGKAVAPAARDLHVAPNGDDQAPGSATKPLRTIAAAIKKSKADGTIVVHAGRYREELKIENRPRLKLVAAPGDEVWLDGSVVVSDWSRSGAHWVSPNWTTDFDSSPTYNWGEPDNTESGWSFVSPDHPMAAHPDQLWVDGEPQVQVSAKSELTAGTFYVDDEDDELFLGSDPTGRTVTASAV